MRRKIIFVLVFSIGLWHVTGSGYMLAKAELSQYLIKEAWTKTLIDDKYHKPWSWADTYPVLKMEIPRLNETNYILEGSSGRNLAFSVTHMSQSGLLGENKTMVLSGHRDSHFSYLNELISGDKIIIHDSNTTIVYEVKNTMIVNSKKQNISIVKKHELLLTSCYPFNAITSGGDLRYVVYAVPIT